MKRSIQTLPELPGIYVFRDGKGTILYVGKSVSLRDRVSSYFQRGAGHSARIGRMVSKVADIEFFVTDTEEEALVLEYEFITRHKPRYNIVFRDDKSYPYLKVTREEYPRILFTRRPQDHEGEVLGPFPSARSLRRTLRFLSTIFPVRSCSVHSRKLHTLRACLDYHIKRCHAPCEGRIDPEAYQAIVRSAVLFLKGRDEELLADLKREMKEAAGSWALERAQRLKEKIEAIERIHAKQEVSTGREEDLDVFAVVSDGRMAVVQSMSVERGRIAAQHKVKMPASRGTPADILEAWLKRHYLAATRIPRTVLLSEPVADGELLARVLGQRSGHRVQIVVPSRGPRARLVQMARRNASLFHSIQESLTEEGQAAIEELTQALRLPRPPAVIECFDISHLGGTETVASMVVAVDGRMDRTRYRRFRIRSVDGIDDFASMREVVGRRYRRLLAEGGELPGLVLLDGGPGQLSAGRQALLDLGRPDLPAAALAKKEEILFCEGFMEGLALPEGSLAHRLVRRIRDEAHRFAITYHRKLRSRRTLTSELTGVPGVGPAILGKLLRHFRDVERVKQAAIDELAGVPGVSASLARKIHEHFRPAPGAGGEAG